MADDPAFDGVPKVDAILPDAVFDEGFLTDTLGAGFTLICIDSVLASAVDDPRLTSVVLDANGPASARLAAGPETAYLVRPDLHIAGRWKPAIAADVMTALKRATGKASQ